MSSTRRKFTGIISAIALSAVCAGVSSSTPTKTTEATHVSVGKKPQLTYDLGRTKSRVATKLSTHDEHKQQRYDLSLDVAAEKKSVAKKSIPFQLEQGVTGTHKYIIRLKESPVSQYQGGVSGLKATNIQAKGASATPNKNTRGVLNAKSNASSAYATYLKTAQTNFRATMQQKLGRSVKQTHAFQYALNGITVEMSQNEAAAVAAMPNVLSVERDIALPIDTSDTPRFIGADKVWSGVSGTHGVKGEGMLVGIIDTGIDHTNPSFAATGADGYEHTNPFGDGVFLGECLDFPGLCNNKLVGSYTFLDGQIGGTDQFAQPGDPVSKDTDGHGSHVASTAAGNVVTSATVYDFEGNDSGISLGTISGIAPHANIISYKVCAPSCYTSDIINAVDQAIIDGVDALNHSIGSVPTSPWAESKALAFLNARAAGIMVQNSAGNTGGPGTAATSGNAPWVTSVAWSTHDRDFTDKYLQDLSGGETPAPANLAGKSLSGSYTGPIVSAGDFDNGDPTPSQCLVPFPAGTFTNQIVVCDRGVIARVQKCANVAAGGAKGCVLTNLQDGANSVDPDMMPIPSIHLSAENGDLLKVWLASGTGHTATISESSEVFSNPAAADILSSSSSAGPYTSFDFLAPSVSAPGVNIFAAGANLQFVHPGLATEDPDDDPSVAGQYGIIGGSSMASPHMTGSAILLKQLHPDWTPAEVLSAFMTTGKTSLLKSDGVTPADAFDIGGGRVQVDVAARAALLLDESVENFIAADPNNGGDPSTLNIASLVQDQCSFECSWQRRVKATVNGSWTASGTGTPGITVSPGNFSLSAGETQTLTITASSAGLAEGSFAFGHVVLTPADSTLPTTTIPVAIQPTTASNPTVFTKSVDKSDAGNGEILTYSLSVKNLGDADIFTVTDAVPTNTIFVVGSETEAVTGGTTTATWTENGGLVTWSGMLDPTTGELIPAPAPFGFIPMDILEVEPLGCPANCDDGAWLVEDTNISFFGKTYTSIIVSINGTIELGLESGSGATATAGPLPSQDGQNNLLAPFWTDLNMEDGGQLYSATLDAGDTSYDVVSWENIPLYGTEGTQTYSFQIWSEQGTGNIWYVYGAIPEVVIDNLSVGFENSSGTVGTNYYFNGTGTEPAVGTDLQIATEVGGSATLSFQVKVKGPVGGVILNEATMQNATSSETAFAFTTINDTGVEDTDGDGLFDDEDNCTLIPNASQCDSDGDGFGNFCDADFNNSGLVSLTDMALITKNLFKTSKAPKFSEYDMNCSGGRVSLDDYFTALHMLWTQPGPSALVGTDNAKTQLD